VGGELLRLIAAHPVFELAAAVSDSRAGDQIADVFGHLASVYPGAHFQSHSSWPEIVSGGSKLALFSAAPHGASASIIKAAIDTACAGDIDLHVVDCSADFRYRDPAAFEAVYGTVHAAPEILADFASAVPEHLPDTAARHIGHPGCFATAVLLASVPLLAAGLCDEELFVSGITGSTGSGRVPQAGTHHPERQSNLYAYKPLAHRHAPEIIALAQAASGVAPRLNFVPHSGPFARGIYVTLQTRSKGPASDKQVREAFMTAYGQAPFIELVEGAPRLKDVVASNRCQVGIAARDDTIVVLAAIDNLVKGAAGGAVQWMNRLWQLDETSGLTMPAPGWT
jgi:N-acetyl-gamma-glutamyl-phosphate reductase